MANIQNRRTMKAKPGDKTLPVVFRFMKAGVLIFKPTPAERAKIALGYSIRVNLTLKMQHNPGEVMPTARMDVTEVNDYGPDAPKVAHLPKPISVEQVKAPAPQEPEKGGGA